jgi:hypothetical protein
VLAILVLLTESAACRQTLVKGSGRTTASGTNNASPTLSALGAFVKGCITSTRQSADGQVHRRRRCVSDSAELDPYGLLNSSFTFGVTPPGSSMSTAPLNTTVFVLSQVLITLHLVPREPAVW